MDLVIPSADHLDDPAPLPNCNPVPLVPRVLSLKSSKFIGSSLCVYVCVIGNRAGLGGSGMHMWAPALVSDMLGGLDFFERPFSTLNTYQHTHSRTAAAAEAWRQRDCGKLLIVL